VRVAVVGIDGAGKSSTTLGAIARLASLGGGTIAKPGRGAFVQRGEQRTYVAANVSSGFERAFKRVDATRNRALIGATRLAFIAYQGWLEPHLVREYRPAVVIATRCMIVDPAIYSAVYSPVLSGISLERRLKAFARLARLPFRDLYVFLRTPAAAAMERIHARIARLPGAELYPRERWLHLHEQEAIFNGIGDAALEAARKLAEFKVVEIETAGAAAEAATEPARQLERCAHGGTDCDRSAHHRRLRSRADDTRGKPGRVPALRRANQSSGHDRYQQSRTRLSGSPRSTIRFSHRAAIDRFQNAAYDLVLSSRGSRTGRG
jgi:thymidylate kinase